MYFDNLKVSNSVEEVIKEMLQAHGYICNYKNAIEVMGMFRDNGLSIEKNIININGKMSHYIEIKLFVNGRCKSFRF